MLVLDVGARCWCQMLVPDVGARCLLTYAVWQVVVVHARCHDVCGGRVKRVNLSDPNQSMKQRATYSSKTNCFLDIKWPLYTPDGAQSTSRVVFSLQEASSTRPGNSVCPVNMVQSNYRPKYMGLWNELIPNLIIGFEQFPHFSFEILLCVSIVVPHKQPLLDFNAV